MQDKEVYVDIEALLPWQEKLVTGFRKGEMTIMMAGRQTGKSTFSSAAFKRLWDDIYASRPITDLILSESPVHGARYYTVQPEGGNWEDMEIWCIRTFGEPGEIWPLQGEQDYGWPECARWYMNNRKFWFRTEKDRDWFIIKWRS